jgi:hypothetical protein
MVAHIHHSNGRRKQHDRGIVTKSLRIWLKAAARMKPAWQRFQGDLLTET